MADHQLERPELKVFVHFVELVSTKSAFEAEVIAADMAIEFTSALCTPFAQIQVHRKRRVSYGFEI